MFSDALSTFLFAFSITMPIFVVLFLGALLKKRQMIDDDFIKRASQLVYKIGLPIMLFNATSTADFGQMADKKLLTIFALTTIVICIIGLFVAHWFTQESRDQGVFTQGAFHGNLVILGLAFCVNAYGEKGLIIATLPVATGAIINNLLAVYVLNRSLSHAHRSFFSTIFEVIKSPIIIAIFLGLVSNAIHLRLPQVLIDSGNYLGQMVLPLALICIGGTLKFSRVTLASRLTLGANFFKLGLTPIIACTLGIFLGMRGEALGILFLLAASPTATISFVMVQALNGNTALAANIIAQSTLLSLFTVTFGLCLLQSLGLI